jgi:hypothetical protein
MVNGFGAKLDTLLNGLLLSTRGAGGWRVFWR